ncbi:MipA/OmpV family protein [Musicola keenii]|uniref:MipA/OmpV family protein n=1 Tax=Musicola keenii TaxID=2884250 RepID=UPI00177E45DD|nr:MipA/OmpV family protein [Musicola keenii]
MQYFPVFITAIFCLNTAIVQADDNNPAEQDGVTVGLASRYAPRYSGASDYYWNPLPVFQARQGAFFADTDKGIGYDLQAGGFYLEQTLGYSFGRTDHNSSWRDGSHRLQGMGTIDGALNTGIEIGWQFSDRLSVAAKAILPLTDSQGAQYQGSITDIFFKNQDDSLGFQASLLFGDARYNTLFYGVSSAQSQRSGYRTYHAGGGLYGQSLYLFWTHQVDRHWAVNLLAGYTHLNDKAADSPIVYRTHQGEGTLAVTYRF